MLFEELFQNSLILNSRYKFELNLKKNEDRSVQVDQLFRLEAEYYKLLKDRKKFQRLGSRFYHLETALESTPQVGCILYSTHICTRTLSLHAKFL